MRERQRGGKEELRIFSVCFIVALTPSQCHSRVNSRASTANTIDMGWDLKITPVTPIKTYKSDHMVGVIIYVKKYYNEPQ